MNISLNLEDYAAQMNRRGWVVIPAVVEQELVARMLDDIGKAWVTCRAIMERNGVATDAELTVHHLIGQQDSFLDLLGELEPLMPYLEHYFGGRFILNSFGGAINTKGHTSYAQRVHRDIRSFSGDLPLMMNTLIMLDEFTPMNGATWMLSGSHKAAEKPSDKTFKAHAEQALGPVGSILMFNSNVWHAGGDNQTNAARRSVTPMFSKPFLKQQFDYPRAVGYDRADEFRPHVRQMIGYNARVPATLDEWYQPPSRRMYRGDQG